MTDEIQNARDFAIGIVAICGAHFLLIIAALTAAAYDGEMCPTALAVGLVVAVGVLLPMLAIVSMRGSFRIFERSPATGLLYSVLLAIFCTAVAIPTAWFFFELAQGWTRLVMGPLGSSFRRQCF
ncbi:hypothetical protein [Burkholderia vietnamiensis]|uniref:hypothetical protein n=1 Tax=Burkholderia vietnamiensis TaxID=60552 RepID=UPI001B9CA847|nr:hypothetical protein [Burkholderia vietnamiensis]MBR8034652.1 hypothetical protein [Burkholderia vietnamiensis]